MKVIQKDVVPKDVPSKQAVWEQWAKNNGRSRNMRSLWLAANMRHRFRFFSRGKFSLRAETFSHSGWLPLKLKLAIGNGVSQEESFENVYGYHQSSDFASRDGMSCAQCSL